MAGRLVLVVGPSGAGKDTLIAAARAALAGDPRFVFVRREVTRAADPQIEDHDSVTETEFLRKKAAGAYALSWQAHGLSYGLPASLASDLEAGRVVVANASRGAIGAAQTMFPGVAVILVDAAPEVRAQRLAGRGRESAAGIAARLAREGAAAPDGAIHIDNSGPLDAGISRFVAALRALAE